jgi:V/A-type H+-transporting ATPase subunit A
MRLLSEEAELEEIVKLVGMDAISAQDRLKLEVARSIREDFLHQNAFDEVDTFTPLKKQHLLLLLIFSFYDTALAALEKGTSIEKMVTLSVREQIGRFKYTLYGQIDAEYDHISKKIAQEIDDINRSERDES